jgi:conjugative relaxase-like TrwC/TraI family protein
MMTVAPVASAADAASYYSSKDNYYFLDDLQSQWLGEGARELGLTGEVDLDAFTNVLHGRLPNGVELGKEVLGNHVHRPGHDLTFSAPKSISMLILAGGDKRLLQAHHEAVKDAMSVIEQMISARDTKEGVTSIVPTGKMVAALFTHDTSRNLDPAIHTHAVIANVTEQEGKWKALATDYIHGAGFIETMYRHQVSLGKIYRNSLQSKVEGLGYETELTGGKHGLWEVKGFPEAVLEEFSSRHREIHAQVGDEASLKSRDVAALDTRQKKVDISQFGLDTPSAKEQLGDAALREKMQSVREALQQHQTTQQEVSPLTHADIDRTKGGEAPDKLPSRESEPENRGPELQGKEPARHSDMTHTTVSVSEKAGPELASKTEAKALPEEPIAKPETQAGRNRLQARWDQQMADLNFNIQEVIAQAHERDMQPNRQPDREPPPDAMQAVRTAISVLSDNKTRFTYGDLLLTAHEAGEAQQTIPDLRGAIDKAIGDNLLAPLDKDKGVFTSHIHLLDELSVQALAADVVKEGKVVSFSMPKNDTPAHLKAVEFSPIAILNAPASISRLREVTEELVTMSREHGREVKVLASSAERGMSLGKSPLLKDDLLQRSRVLDKAFSLSPQSTLVVEGAERLGLKEMLVLTGEAKEKNAQLIFLDSAGRQSNANALSVLSEAGVSRHGLTEPAPGLEARVVSISDKRDRYRALAERYADLNSPDAPVTASVVGAREQQQLTGIIRDALQNAGKLGRDSLTIEARTPVFVSAKAQRLPATYRDGMVLEDRSDKNETRHYVIDRVHEETRMLSLVDSDGVLNRVKLSELSSDWRLFNSEQLGIAEGEQLFALAGDKASGLKARDRLTVTAIENGTLTLLREGQKKPLTLATDKPLYVTHGYVSAPGSRDNERGVVLASLNARDLTANMMNALSQSGSEAEIFTGEAQNRAEDKLGRMRTTSSPLSLVRQASGKGSPDEALSALKSGLSSDAQKAVRRAIGQMRDVAFDEVKLLEQAGSFYNNLDELRAEVARQVKEGDLISVPLSGNQRFVSRATWEMEKAIISDVEAGKNAVTPLMRSVDPVLLNGLTPGQRASTTLILQSPDRFTAVQGYAGVGKTTQLGAVKNAIETLKEDERPTLIGLAPTHRAVKEMRAIGIEAQTLKSFVLDWQQRTAAGETVRYDKTLFVIDESSMLGNQDTAAAYRAITQGDGRAVPVGDIAQLESPESGAPFRLIQGRSPIDVAVMKEIVRQRNDDLKSAVYSVIENKAGAALEKIQRVSPAVVPREAGEAPPARSVIETDSPVESIVADYMSRTPAARDKTMIVAQLHEDRRAINSGIHAAMLNNNALGEKAVNVTVLDRVTGGRHDFNRIADWESGQVVLLNERYLNVSAVDAKTDRVILHDEAGRRHYFSPAELNATEMEVFERREIELREGDFVRTSKTQKQAGHAAHEQYRVEQLKDNGEIVLKNQDGEKTVDPKRLQADQHLDYAWAVTGYGAQGASENYVISLEGTEGARERMSGMRAFYISISRARDHVQVYTDGLKDWVNTLRPKDDGARTAHDVLKPETERAQARSIWAMGQPVGKTAIGRTFLREQGLKDSPVKARVIPPTKKYPEPHLALPVYDDNGKTAGLTLVPLRSDSGHIETGPARQLITDTAQAAMLLKSQNGETLVVNTLQEGLAAAREHPKYGVIIMAKDVEPSAQLMKVSGGKVAVSEGIVSHAIESDDLQRYAEDIKSVAQSAVGNDDARYREPSEAELEHALASSAQEPHVPVIPEQKPEPPLSDAALLRLATALDVVENVPDVPPEKGKDVAPDRYSEREKQLADKLLDTSIDDRQLVNQVRAEQLSEQREIERPELTPEHVKHIQKER